MAGVGRGLLGAVGLPLSGALNLVSGVAAGIGSTTGVLQRPSLRHAPSSMLNKLALSTEHPALVVLFRPQGPCKHAPDFQAIYERYMRDICNTIAHRACHCCQLSSRYWCFLQCHAMNAVC